MLKMPWFVCLLAATLLGGIWGAIPGFFKAYFNINEVITSIMFNWIGLYLVNELVYQNGTGPMYDVRNTRTLNLSKNPAFAQSIIPDFGLNKMFQTNSTTIAIFLAAAVAILIWVVLNKTTFGYELKAVGLNKSAARYAGINEKKNIILSMAIAGALAGFGAGLYFLSNVAQWNPLNSTSCRPWASTAFPLHCWQAPTPSAPSSRHCSFPTSRWAARSCPPSITPRRSRT